MLEVMTLPWKVPVMIQEVFLVVVVVRQENQVNVLTRELC